MPSRLAPVLLFIGATLSLVPACKRSDAAPPAPPPASVSFVALVPETVPIQSEWITTLDGYVNAQIRPQVSGYLIKRNYDEGAPVKKGQVLFEIDARPLAAALAKSQADLAQAQAQLGRTERDVARDTPLAKERAIPQSQLDNDVQAHLAAQATIKSAQAAIDTAQLNVEFTKVRSLIDGIAAIASAQIGDLVGPATLLTTVSQVDPIKANFSLSEQEYLGVAKQLNQKGGTKEIWKTGTPLSLTLADGSEYTETGTFLAADREIDPKTGTIRISAVFPNPDRLLRPGQYGRVRAETLILQHALLVPQRAVSELQGAFQVRVVGADNKVVLKNVSLGNRVGSRWVVTKGLEPGERVVLDGPQIREGTVVNPTAAATAVAEDDRAGTH